MYSGEFLPDSQVHYFPLEDNPVGGRHNLVEKKSAATFAQPDNQQSGSYFIYLFYLSRSHWKKTYGSGVLFTLLTLLKPLRQLTLKLCMKLSYF